MNHNLTTPFWVLPEDASTRLRAAHSMRLADSGNEKEKRNFDFYSVAGRLYGQKFDGFLGSLSWGKGVSRCRAWVLVKRLSTLGSNVWAGQGKGGRGPFDLRINGAIANA